MILLVENFNTDPYCNHALEEWLMDNYSDDCFMLWRNQTAVLLGKNQNAYSEINLPYAKERGVKLVRRITGGGAVYTDEGTIMFTFISASGDGLTDFRKFTEPVLKALWALGIPAEFTGRNDLTINGGKFSGNAQCTYGGKLLHHGTLMYKTDINEMARVLQVNELKLRDKGVASVRSRVTNISDHMKAPMDIEDFRSYLFNSVMESNIGATLLRLSDEDWEAVRKRAAKTHAADKWIYGQSPVFNVKKEAKLPGGMIQVYLSVAEGRIEKASVFGDFFGDNDVDGLEKVLCGVEYDTGAIQKALSPLPFEQYLRNITLDEFISVIE